MHVNPICQVCPKYVLENASSTKQCASPMNCPFPNLTEDYPNPYHVQNTGSPSTKRMKLRCVDLFA